MDEINKYERTDEATGRGGAFFVTVGWISAILSLFFYPFIFGVLGVIMGILGTKKQSRAGVALIATSIVFMGIGLIYKDVLVNWIGRTLGFF